MAAAKKKISRPKDFSGAVEPSVRTFTSWTTALIRQAEVSANSGNFRLLSQLCEWILGDDRVQSTLSTRLNALFGLEPTFEASGDKRRSNRAVKALDAGEDWWAAYPESESRQIVSWGLVLGIGPFRHAWEANEEHEDRWLPMPAFWHPQHLRQDQNTKQWSMLVAADGAALSAGREVAITAGDGEWGLHCPFGKNRPWSMGLWRSLAPLVLLKHFARQDWAEISERSVILVLTCLNQSALNDLKGYTKDARAQLAADIYARGRSAVAALPPGIDLKSISAAIKSDDVQGALVRMVDEAIAIAIRGGNLTTNVQEGSRAATETQARAGDLGNLRFDAQAWTTTIHDQSLVWWAQFNYGDKRLAPYPVYPVEPEEDRKAKAETEEKAFTNVETAERLGFDVDRKSFLEEYKITWAKPGEKPPEPTPVAPPPDPNQADQEQSPPPPPGEPRTEEAADVQALAGAVADRGNGEHYADRVRVEMTKRGAKELAPTVAAMVAAVRNANSFEEAEKAIAAKYKKLPPPEKLASLTEAALVMAQFGGHVEVDEE